jgi:hypothetical protein
VEIFSNSKELGFSTSIKTIKRIVWLFPKSKIKMAEFVSEREKKTPIV